MALVKLHPRMLEVSGALLSASSSQSIPNGDWTSLTWDIERHDLDGWFDGANPDRLTVVPGVAFVRVSAGFRWGSNSMTGLIQARIVKNDGTFPGQPQVAQIPSGNDAQFLVVGQFE